MRNLKRALSLALASVMVMGLMVVGTGASYVDVSSEQNQEAIEVLQAVGVMTGDENGNFNPDANVTRNEMAVVMSNLMDYRVASYAGTSPFTDVPASERPGLNPMWPPATPTALLPESAPPPTAAATPSLLPRPL